MIIRRIHIRNCIFLTTARNIWELIGNSRGDVFVYDFVKGKKKILTRLKDSKITDIIRLENNSLVISNNKGQIIILG